MHAPTLDTTTTIRHLRATEPPPIDWSAHLYADKRAALESL